MGFFRKKSKDKKGTDSEGASGSHLPPPPPVRLSSELPDVPSSPKRREEMVLPPLLEPDPGMEEWSGITPPEPKPAPQPKKPETLGPVRSPLPAEQKPVEQNIVKPPVVVREVPAMPQQEKETARKEEPEVKPQNGELHKSIHKSEQDLYLNVEEYKGVTKNTYAIEDQLKRLDSTTKKVDELRSEEDGEFRKWRSVFDDMRKKLMFVDELLFESKG